MSRVRQGRVQSVECKHQKGFFFLFVLCTLLSALSLAWSAEPSTGYFSQGVTLYQAGRNSDAIDAFEQAIKHKEQPKDAQDYIDRIRKETVERIRNKALTGVNKTKWQSKYFFLNEVEGRIHVGISVQEVFEHDSLNFRPGAVDALSQLAAVFAKAQASHFDVELVNEISAEGGAPSTTLTVQQLNTVFSYLSLASRNALPKF